MLTFSINTIFIEKVLNNIDIEKLNQRPFLGKNKRDLRRHLSLNSIQRNIFSKDGLITDLKEESSICRVREINESPYYKIEGLLYGGNAKSSVVLITIKAKSSQDAFKLNDVLPQGEVLVDIKENGILLKKLSCPYFLLFKGGEDKEKAKFSDPSKAIYKEPGFERTQNKIKTTHSWVKQVLSDNFSGTLEQARAVPFYSGGRMRGFRLIQIDSGSVYEKIGLKNGDVIISINGESLNDAAKAIQILSTLRNRFEGKAALSIKLKILRAGKPLTYEMQVE